MASTAIDGTLTVLALPVAPACRPSEAVPPVSTAIMLGASPGLCAIVAESSKRAPPRLKALISRVFTLHTTDGHFVLRMHVTCPAKYALRLQ